MPAYKKNWWHLARQFQTKLISTSDLEAMLPYCKDVIERIALILLFYTAARPSELVKLKMGHIKKVGKKLISVSIPTLKRSIGRTIFLPLNALTQELLDYVKDRPEDLRLFLYKLHNPFNIRDLVYRVSQGKLTAYFFRHSRLTQLAQAGASLWQLLFFKGSRKVDSILPYIQLSGSELKTLAKKIE